MSDCIEPEEIAEHDAILCAAALAICPACSYRDGVRVRVTGESYEVWCSDSAVTLAFWDGYYGRPMR